ncbi:MAG: 2-dehydro-3-deoxy-6-phosphogalactonate aldolase [Acidobacteria bacterium]|nr:2-dehydro-3-deoxy-6-phosphogalactonate aldolase [Acidobacteriota bacterium]
MNLRMWLERSPLIAILRGVKPSEAETICAALEEAGIAIVEVPLNSPEPLKSIEALACRFGDRMLIGAGTLTSVSDVASVASAGGRLIVTPHADVSIVRAAKAARLIAVPGFFNPTEAFALLHAGADAIKLFPADVLGPNMLKAMRAVLPKEAIVIPVGGVGAAQIPAWRNAGAQGFGLGSSLYKPGDSPAAVKSKAQALIAALRQD